MHWHWQQAVSDDSLALSIGMTFSHQSGALVNAAELQPSCAMRSQT